jgi:RNA polymerase sigma-70 factor (ECF subfamily)
LYAEYQPALLRYLRGRGPDIAEDVASETWISAAQNLNRFEGDADQFRAWLFTIARRRLIDQRRAEKRRPVVHDADDATQELPARDPSPEDLVTTAIAGDDAARRIANILSADQADVILMRVVGGLSVEDVARIIGKAEVTVRVLQSRGLKRLQKYL